MTDAPRILVVEDNPVTRKSVCLALSSEGFAVLAAETGAQAIAHIAAGPVDLVLQDINLPDMDGFELLPRLLAAAHRVPPVVALSGTASPERAREAGFAELLVKPVEPSRLLRIVRGYVEPESAAAENVGGGRTVLVVDDDAVQLKLEKVQLEALGFRVATAKNGIEAMRRLRGEPPAAVVSDVLMSRMDGFELCRAIRTDPRLAMVPIILVSAHDLTADETNLALRFGADATVFRGGDPSALAEALLAALDGPSGAAVENAPTQRLRPVGGEDSHRRERMWRAVLALLARLTDVASRPLGEDEVIEDVLASFLDACGCPIGAAYLAEPDGSLVPRAHLGLGPEATHHIADFWGHAAWLHRVLGIREAVTVRRWQDAGDLDDLLVAIGARSMLLAPILLGDERLGVVVLATPIAEVPDDWLSLATAVSGPIAKSIALARTVARLAHSENRFRSIAEATADGIVVTDARGAVVYGNPAARELAGRSDVELRALPLGELLPFLRPTGGTQEAVVVRPDGSQVPVEVTVRGFEDPPGHRQSVYVLRNLSDRYRLDELMRIATRDTLTGLSNRRRFQEDVVIRLAESRRYGNACALLVIDLDRFKVINDTYGHQIGDAVLSEVGHLLQRITRESDVAARLGGDEFVLLLPRSGGSQARACAQKILDGIGKLSFAAAGQTLRVGTSIGVAVFPKDGPSAEELFVSADTALYRAKQLGRNRICVAGEDE